ncbi:Sodium-dependent phosphate transporter 1-A [Hypsibius exemplaris]|uniref:Phosphate transporter n=1 Tax=Hypsibius exemplaris TaxID=2072580 RepID=A0A1W0WQL3_HYPEX|nr:Sodium-dependent phosphate transporter 1-A [Hypsibius exemplaris]
MADPDFPSLGWAVTSGLDWTTLSSLSTTTGDLNVKDIAFNPAFLWVVILGFVVAFVLAFAVGANDVANSFGTSVGSKVLTLRQACIMAVIFETLGACLLGSQVSDTIWKEIVDIGMYKGEERALLLGEVSALLGTAIWLLAATLLKVPVSGTHAIVGSTMGFSFVKHGPYGIHWLRIIRIVGSWFVSPVLAGAISGFLFILVRMFILKSTTPLESGLKALPVFYAVSIFVNTISIFLGGAIEAIPWWGGVIISVSLSLITGLVVHFWVVPWKRRVILSNLGRLKARNAVALVCQMNSSVATNLDMLDDSYGDDRVGYGMQTAFGTSTTTLDELGDTVEIEKQDQNEQIDEEEEEDTDFDCGPAHEIHDGRRRQTMYPTREEIKLKSYLTVAEEEEETESPKFRKKSVHTYKLAGQPVIKPDYTVMLKNGDGPSTAKERRELKQGPNAPRGNIFSRCCSAIRHAIFGDLADQDINSLAPPEDPPEIAAIFSFLQILTATFTAFAHGGNDVSNAIGPLVAIWVIFSNGSVPEQTSTPLWLLLFGGFGISVGLCVLGRKVIETVGSSLAVIIPSSGFCIGLGTACTVLICSKIGLPVSTTHCIVGSVVAVGWLRSRRAVNWKVFGNIMACAFITVPVAAACGAGSMALLGLIPL